MTLGARSATLAGRTLLSQASCQWQGVLTCALIALSATFVAEHHGGPALLYALLFGLSLNFLSVTPATAQGIQFSASTLLRVGVALLGVRITFGQVADLGWSTVLLVAAGVAATIAFGWFMARAMGRTRDEGLLTGAAVGVCGASAALAVSCVLPQTRENQRLVLATIVGVTLLSTAAMIAYPLALKALDVAPLAAGIFLGGTIHDVAQVAGSGAMLGPAVTETAVLVKLLRVAMLAPVVIAIGILLRERQDNVSHRKVPVLPGFVVAFAFLIVLASTSMVPPTVLAAASSASRWLLLMGIAAAGLKTNLQEISSLGWQPAVVIVAETAFLAFFVAGGMLLNA